uniref:Uncharacterized protein n=1 Tax=Anguilla anguilla TaxID=7936 RepID=A0A0E9SNT7_ANGAN
MLIQIRFFLFTVLNTIFLLLLKKICMYLSKCSNL